MQIVIEIIKILLPCTALVTIAYWLINRPIKIETLKLQNELDRQNSKIVTPIKLSAYERLVLFLERTSPDEILNRETEPDMSAFDLQIRLLKVIREEFEHNVSQQIYVSKASWQAVIGAKENILQLVNISASQVSPNEQAIKLAQMIIATYSSAEETATKNAVELLKNEIGKLIN
jgi:hypothetical protein